METKFEYQVSPELAEKIALEQYEVVLRVSGVKLKYFPLGIGALVALLLFFTASFGNYFLTRPGYYSIWRPNGGNFAFVDSSIWAPIGFVLGYLIGSLIRGFVRSRIIALARSAYKKMGPHRTVSWNSESIAFQSPFYEIKVRWEVIDRIEIAPLGVYGLAGRRAFFAIPGEAFPSNTTPHDLTRAWQTAKYGNGKR